MDEREAEFGIGQVVHHRLFDYLGVVYDVDPRFSASEEWYQRVAKSRPPKDRPWYRVLVDGSPHTTYVAQRNLEPTAEPREIRHPLIDRFFEEFRDGRYLPRRRAH